MHTYDPPLLQRPVYVGLGDAAPAMVADAARSAGRVAVRHGSPILIAGISAVVGALAFYYVPKFLDGWEERRSENVELEVEG